MCICILACCMYVCMCVCCMYECDVCIYVFVHVVCMFAYVFVVCMSVMYVYMYLCMLCMFVGEGKGTPLQYSCLENPMEGGAWWAAVHGIAKSRTRLSDFTFTFHFHALEKEMATHSSVLAWRIPGTGELGGLTSMGSYRVGHG